MNGEKKEVPKGTLGRVELYCLSIGQVIGAGVITLVGPARGRKFFCVFKIGSSIQLELDM